MFTVGEVYVCFWVVSLAKNGGVEGRRSRSSSGPGSEFESLYSPLKQVSREVLAVGLEAADRVPHVCQDNPIEEGARGTGTVPSDRDSPPERGGGVRWKAAARRGSSAYSDFGFLSKTFSCINKPPDSPP